MQKKSPLGFNLVANKVTENAPLLYRIYLKRIGDEAETTIYVGKSSRGCARPFVRYDRNLQQLLNDGKPLNGTRFRDVHHDLQAAHIAGHPITVELVRNVDIAREGITHAERALQLHFNLPTGRKMSRRVLDDLGATIRRNV